MRFVEDCSLTMYEKRFLSIFWEFVWVLCVTRSFRQAVLTFVSVTTSKGCRTVVLCGGKQSSSIRWSIASLMIRVLMWALCPSKISNTGFGMAATNGMKCFDNQSKKMCSSTHPEGVTLKRVPAIEFLQTQELHRCVPEKMMYGGSNLQLKSEQIRD